MSSGALRAAWEAAQQPQEPGRALRAAWERANPTGHNGVPFVDAAPEAPPGIVQKTLGTIASAGRDIPGVEAAQSGLRALFRGESYRQARDDIRGAEDAAPALARVPARLFGGTLGALALPGGAVRQGATYGALSGALDSDPDSGVGDRAKQAAVGATVGALTGKFVPAAITAGRSLLGRTLGQAALSRAAAGKAASEAAYGIAKAEGAAATATPQAVIDAFQEPDIAPYVKLLKESRAYRGSDDATILREARKLMSKDAVGLDRQMKEGGYDAVKDLKIKNLRGAREQLLTAAEVPGPSEPVVETAVHRPSTREAIDNFHDRNAVAAGRRLALTEETSAQRMAREALERHHSEGVVSPPLRGAPPTQEGPALMPSLRAADRQHAANLAERGAFNEGADASKRILAGSQARGNKLTTKSPEAFLEQIKTLKPNEASAQREGVLGTLRHQMSGGLEPQINTGFGLTKLFGVAPSYAKAYQLHPFVDALDAQSGDQAARIARILRGTAIAGITP